MPVPEAHKYVIPPISYGLLSVRLYFDLSFSLFLSLVQATASPCASWPRRRFTVTLATPYVFLRGCSSSRQYKGKHGKSFVPKENTMQYPGRPGRDATAYVSPILPLSSSLLFFSSLSLLRMLHTWLSSFFLSFFFFSVLFFVGAGISVLAILASPSFFGGIARAISQPLISAEML